MGGHVQWSTGIRGRYHVAISEYIRKVLLNQLNLVSGEVFILLCLILGNCHILSNVNYLINIAVLSIVII